MMSTQSENNTAYHFINKKHQLQHKQPGIMFSFVYIITSYFLSLPQFLNKHIFIPNVFCYRRFCHPANQWTVVRPSSRVQLRVLSHGHDWPLYRSGSIHGSRSEELDLCHHRRHVPLYISRRHGM